MKHEITAKGLSWINVQSPEPEELAEFIRLADLVSADAEYLAQKYHRPSVTIRDAYIMLLINVPVFDRRLRLTKGVALFFIIKEGALYTLQYEPIISLEKIRRDFEELEERREEYFSYGSMQFCLDLITLLNEGAWRKLERLMKHIDIAEDAVFQGNERKMVEEISLLKRDVMDFRKVIRPQERLFQEIPRHLLVVEEAQTKWSRVHGQMQKMWDVLESMFESVKELASTNYNLLQHKENELLRLLTIYSIIVIPMLIITDPMFTPGAKDAGLVDIVVFWAVLGVLIITLLFIFLKYKGGRLN